MDSATGHLTYLGGGNTFAGNTITRPANSGIVVFGCLPNSPNPVLKDTSDTITGNTVVDAGYGGSTSASTGCGTFDTTGVGISIGNGDRIYGNTVTDDRAVPTTWYGVQLGARFTTSTVYATVTGAVLTDPSGQLGPNTATGVVAGLYRYGPNAPQPATSLTGQRGPVGVTLNWAESYAMAGTPVGGYRIYRNGALVGTVPVGGPTVPGNLLSDAQSSLESGIAGWTPATGSAISWNSAVGAVGTASLAVAPTRAGTIGANSGTVPVTAGATYTSVASYQSTGASRRVRSGITWLDANGAVISRVASGNTATTDSATGWMTSWYSAVAPANAVSAQGYLLVDNVAMGETHLIDRIGLVAGNVTETWTDPAPLAGAATYHVVAYNGTSGDNSAVAPVTVQ